MPLLLKEWLAKSLLRAWSNLPALPMLLSTFPFFVASVMIAQLSFEVNL